MFENGSHSTLNHTSFALICHRTYFSNLFTSSHCTYRHTVRPLRLLQVWSLINHQSEKAVIPAAITRQWSRWGIHRGSKNFPRSEKQLGLDSAVGTGLFFPQSVTRLATRGWSGVPNLQTGFVRWPTNRLTTNRSVIRMDCLFDSRGIFHISLYVFIIDLLIKLDIAGNRNRQNTLV